MEQILKKLRLKNTLATTLIAGIILLVLFSGFFALLFGSTEFIAARTLETVLEAEDKRPEDTDKRCFSFFIVGNQVFYNPIYANDISYYGDEASKIVQKSIAIQEGKFMLGKKAFKVMSKVNDEGVLIYAVYDRSSDRENLINTSVIIAMLYFASMLLIALIAYFFSSRTLAPVGESFKKQRDLIANASHELKTPLTIIGTNLMVMKSEQNSTIADNEKWITSIDTQIARMSGLIQNMLELSKLEQKQIVKEDVNLSEIVEGACLAFDAVCFEKGARLESQIQPDIHTFGEKNALERLVIILLDNAVKYCGDKGKIGCSLSADKKIHLAIMNTGAAIAKEDEKLIFDRFYRTDGARENPSNNSFGLGLSIAQATVIAHNGEISCHGVENKGSVFDVVLPLTKKAKIA